MNFIRTTGDIRDYYEVYPDVVGVLHLQAGNRPVGGTRTCACSTTSRWARRSSAVLRRPVSDRATSPLAPRTTRLGGTNYWGASVEFQTPLVFLPKEVGIKAAVYADAGSLWDYKGPDFIRDYERVHHPW